MSIILCGLPMCGKTTIGKLLAKQLGWNFIDTDHLIERAYTHQTGEKLSCRQIYVHEGEEKFRALEKQQIATLKGSNKEVISIGGGALTDPENVAVLQETGRLVYLRTSLNVLWERTHQRGIPAYLDPEHPKEAFYKLAKRRIPFYERAAFEIIDVTHLSLQEVVDTLAKLVKDN